MKKLISWSTQVHFQDHLKHSSVSRVAQLRLLCLSWLCGSKLSRFRDLEREKGGNREVRDLSCHSFYSAARLKARKFPVCKSLRNRPTFELQRVSNISQSIEPPCQARISGLPVDLPQIMLNGTFKELSRCHMTSCMAA